MKYFLIFRKRKRVKLKKEDAMKHHNYGFLSARRMLVTVLTMIVCLAAYSQKVKDTNAPLDSLVFVSSELRVVETTEDFWAIKEGFVTQEGILKFLSENSGEWKVFVDKRRGVPSLIDGGAIPFIPGPANDLSFRNFGASCESIQCIPKEKVETLAREFLDKYPGLFPVKQEELVADPDGTIAIGEAIYLLRFQWVIDGIPVENGSIFFRINNGNLIQIASTNISAAKIDTNPSFTKETAFEILSGYLGKDGISEKDELIDNGSLTIVPTTPKGLDANVYSGPVGEMISYNLAYRIVFRRPGVMGTWEALIDAHSGEILRFVDANRYGKIQGGVYKTDKNPTQTEVTMPFPYADYGSGVYADIGGNYSGTSGTSTMTGRTGSAGNVGSVDIVDTCGTISLASDGAGLIDFGTSGGTDCTTPGVGGAGNTHASRTQYYNVSWIKIKAYTYLSGNSWLQGLVTDNVNINQNCNAYWNGSSLNFFKSGGGCGNTGELPGVSLHEWGHGMDDNDGSGGESPPIETRADWTAILQTHQSCAGGGFFMSLDRGCGNPPSQGSQYHNCGGYGDCCLDCSGVRDADWNKHSSHTPWTIANYGTVWSGCDSGSYYGPCGKEDHCESGIASQALWDLAVRDLPTYCGMDTTSAWQLIDRLWYSSMPSLGNMYTCIPPNSNGCGGGSLFNLFKAIDDDGDGTANGTPHAQGIFQAFNRHMIACGAAGDATNQNQTTCPTLAIATLTGTPANNTAILNWGSVTNATRYFVYRNDSSCDSGFTRIATVNVPTTTYIDNTGTNGITSYYRIQAATNNDSCVSAMSNCVAVTPQPCGGSVTLSKSIYNCSDTGTITVLDSTAPSSPFTVEIWSTTDATHRSVTMTGTSQIFTGTFTTTTGTPGPNQVKVSHGDTIYVRYVDPDYCGTPNVNAETTASIDCAGPVISNVTVSEILDTSVTVSWVTDEPANSRVTYGTITPPAVIVEDLTNYGTSHSIVLTGLSGCTNYFFSVTSADYVGNSTTDNNNGLYYSFKSGGGTYILGPDNVENGVSSWIATGYYSLWHRDTCRAFSGSYSWKAGANDFPACSAQYPNYSNTYLTWNQNINLGAVGNRYHLRWAEWYSTEFGYDFLIPEISLDGGVTWADLAPSDSGQSNGWVRKDVDLSSYSGSQVRIRFLFHSDGYKTDEGVYLDDIGISKSYGCTTELLYQSHTLTDTCSGGGPGNNDGYLDPGEDSVITITALNTGLADATNVTGTLTTSTSGIVVLDNSATFPNIAANGGTGTSLPNHFSIHVDSSVPCGTLANFILHMVSDQNPSGTDSTFSILIGRQGNTVTVFHEDFSGVTVPALPAGWTRGKNGGNDWETEVQYGCPGNTLIYRYSDYQADSWVYTPGIVLTAGVEYTLSFRQKTDGYSYPENLSVRIDTDNNHYNGKLATLWSQEALGNDTCNLRTVNFTVPTTGTYYFEFWCWSQPEMSYLYVDEINLTYQQPATCNACTPSCTAPGAPNLTAATGTCTGVNLSWTAGTGTTNSYNVYRVAGACGGAYSKIAGPLTGTTYSDTTATGGTSYAYVIRGACDEGGLNESPNSNCRTAASLAPNPTITGGTANVCPAVTVLLTTESGQSNYQWYVGGTPIGGANAYQYTANSTGSYTVSYINGSGCSGTSAAHPVTISACAPNIVYQSHGAPTEITGNGDVYYDRGEKWSVQVNLTNTGTAGATNVTATLSGNGITVCTPTQSFGNIGVGGTGSATFEFVIDSNFTPCGGSIGFDVTSKNCTEKTPAGADENDVFSLTVGKPIMGTPTEIVIQPSVGDSYVNQNSAGTNYGTATTMVTNVRSNREEDVLVQFDLSGIPAGSTINSATLELYNTVAPASSYSVSVMRNTATWAEGTVTWNNKPAYDTTAVATITPTTAVGWKVWTVTSAVQGWFAGTYPNYGFTVKPTATSGNTNILYTFASKENETTGNRPILRVNYTPPSYYDCSYVGSGSCGGCQPPSQPVIGTITDNDACAQSGISIPFTSGSPATRHDLYRDSTLVQSNVTSPISYDPGDTSSHSYVIRAVNGNDTCYTDSTAVAFTDANNTPATPAPTNNGPICAGSTLNLSANMTADSYAWAGPNGFTSMQQNPSVPNATTAATGDYSLVVTVSGCSSAAGTTHAVVNALPAPTISGPNANTCPSQSVDLTTEAGMTGYQWYQDGSPVGSNSNTYSATASGNYTVSYTNGNGCSGTSAPHSVTITTCEVPPEIATGSNYTWAASQTSQTMGWNSESTATGYRVYRGTKGQLANLSNSNQDFCTRYDGTNLNLEVTSDDPATIDSTYRVVYYLIVAYNAGGEGPAGNARTVDTTGNCP
jgi:hypothetical protein